MEVNSKQEVKIPKWVMAMIETRFNIIKGVRRHRGHLKYFCVDCCGGSLTESQKKAKHGGHTVLQAYTCSHNYVFRVKDIIGLRSRGLDVSGVAPFVINSGLVYYPKSPKHSKNFENKYGVNGLCLTCGRGLTHPGFFCSILCKFLFSLSPHYSNHAILPTSTFISDDQNQAFAGSVSKKKRRMWSKLKKTKIKKDKKKKKVTEEEARRPPSLKRKRSARGDINKTETNEATFVEDNQGFGGSVTDCKKKKIDNKEDETKAKLGASAFAAAGDGDGGMKKTETTNDEYKLLQILSSAVVTDGEKLSPRKRRPRKGIPCRAPFY